MIRRSNVNNDTRNSTNKANKRNDKLNRKAYIKIIDDYKIKWNKTLAPLTEDDEEIIPQLNNDDSDDEDV